MEQNFNIEDFENKFREMKTSKPFRVPENYFENLPSEISDKIIKHKKGIFQYIFLFNLKRILIYASFIIIIALIVGRNHFKNGTETELSSEEITKAILNDDVLFNSFDEETLVAALINEDNADTSIKTNKNVQKISTYSDKTEVADKIFASPDDTTITEEDIINYLNENEGMFISNNNENDN